MRPQRIGRVCEAFASTSRRVFCHFAGVRYEPPQYGAAAKASDPLGPSRPATRDPPHGFSFHKRVVPPVPFKRQELAYGSKPPCGGRCCRAARGAPVTAIGPGSKFRPDRCRHLSHPLLHWPASSSEERTGVPVLNRYAMPGPAPAKKRPGAVPGHRSASFGLSIDTLLTQGASKGQSPRRFMLQLRPKGGRVALADPPGIPADPSRTALRGGIRLRGSVSATASFRPSLSSAKKELGRQ